MFKLILGLLLICLVNVVYALSPLYNYDQLLLALKQGSDVRAIIDLDRCHLLQSKGEQPDLSGAFTRMDFKYFSFYKVPVANGQTRFAAATSYSTLVEHRQFGLVYSYARLRIFDDNTADLHIAHYDAKTHALKDQMDFSCPVGNPSHADGVMLYMVWGD